MDKWMKVINKMDVMDKAETAIKSHADEFGKAMELLFPEPGEPECFKGLDVAFAAIGNEELGPFVGRVVECPNCGDLHKVRYGDKIEKDGTLTPSKMLGYVKCNNGSSYLVTIDGKEFKK